MAMGEALKTANLAASQRELENLQSCPICASKRIQPAPVQPTPPFGVMHCSDCYAVFLSPRPRIEDMSSFYEEMYDEEREKSSRQERRAQKHVKRLAQMMRTPGHVLEVGAGDGYFLKAARDIGWNVTGLELSPPRIAKAREWFGLELIDKDLIAANLPAESFDVIAMYQLIEHVHDPAAILRCVHGLLRPGGLLMLSTPNVLSYARKKRDVNSWMIPQHLFFFSPLSLVNVAEKTGFRVMRPSLLMQAKLERRMQWKPWSAMPMTGLLRDLLTPFALRLIAKKI